MTLERYVTRVVHVEAMQLSSENMGEAAELTGAFMTWDQKLKGFCLVLDVPNGKIRCIPGMWMVKNRHGWLAMNEKKFRVKYVKEEANLEDLEGFLDTFDPNHNQLVFPPYDR